MGWTNSIKRRRPKKSMADHLQEDLDKRWADARRLAFNAALEVKVLSEQVPEQDRHVFWRELTERLVEFVPASDLEAALMQCGLPGGVVPTVMRKP